ncbi:hypothetical protein [Rheinheimera sp.]|jgi:RNA polymerase-binding transcription factor DksA|uniref:hypothetical protein n=1 Tax=Rheinheimera sp. TaxID=1869214 RepID=UPI00260B96B8|nr:hypothetical protein [Rheinheimera sp.]MCA1928445.1 hypothetical protein [Rheinheimera sp.]
MPMHTTQYYQDKLEQELTQVQQKIVCCLEHSQDPDYLLLATKLQAESVQKWPELMSGVFSEQLKEYRNRLEQLEASLSQIQIGQYGYCADCEAALPFEQLEQDPARQRCDSCRKS